jgi:hypothetical protein
MIDWFRRRAMLLTIVRRLRSEVEWLRTDVDFHSRLRHDAEKRCKAVARENARLGAILAKYYPISFDG